MRCENCPTYRLYYLGCPTPALAETMKGERWECAFEEKDFTSIYIPEIVSGLGNVETSRGGRRG